MDEDVVFIWRTTEYYSAIKKNGNFAICSNMDGLGGHCAEWNKSDKDKYCMISLVCGL